MPILFSAPRCAPYSVFVGERLVGRAPTLVELHRLVDGQTRQIMEERDRLIELRARRQFDYIVRPLPDTPKIRVFDARGVKRDEFNCSWRILWFFDCTLARLARVVDHGWDGDVRPRGAPVPGTGRPHGRYGRNYLRRPATQSQRRWAYSLPEEGEPPLRSSRRICSLPSAWDDLPRRSWKDRSWKKFRHTQWKAE